MAGVEASAAVDGVTGAGGMAASAVAAVGVEERRVGRKFAGPEHFAEEDLTADAVDDELVVESDNTEAGARGPVTLAYRSGVDADAGLAAESLADVFGEGVELTAHDGVVVVAESVVGDVAVVIWLAVVEGAADDRAGAVEEQPRVAADIVVALEVGHRAVASGGNPVAVDGDMAVVDGTGLSIADAAGSAELGGGADEALGRESRVPWGWGESRSHFP